MQPWKNKLLSLARKLDDTTDNIFYRLRQRLGTTLPLQIIPYRTYGTATNIYIRGRILEQKKIAVSSASDTAITNIVNMYKRFETDEVAGATVTLTFENQQLQTITDKEGYFVFNITPKQPFISEDLYHSFSLSATLASKPTETDTATAEMMVPPIDAEYGIISDIDDTIIRTGAGDLLAMGKTVLLANAKTRLPFGGVSAFYKALQLGRNGKRNNPVFYVSSSPWNLYDLLVDFMDHNEIPAGPILLRDFGIQSDTFMSSSHLGHKFKEISQILDTYPKLNFVLIGDSGEEDPIIYLAIVKQYPTRILAVYIRDVMAGEKHRIAVETAVLMKKEGVEMVLTAQSIDAAKHAADAKLIFTEAINEVITDAKADIGAIPGKASADQPL